MSTSEKLLLEMENPNSKLRFFHTKKGIVFIFEGIKTKIPKTTVLELEEKNKIIRHYSRTLRFGWFSVNESGVENHGI